MQTYLRIILLHSILTDCFPSIQEEILTLNHKDIKIPCRNKVISNKPFSDSLCMNSYRICLPFHKICLWIARITWVQILMKINVKRCKKIIFLVKKAGTITKIIHTNSVSQHRISSILTRLRNLIILISITKLKITVTLRDNWTSHLLKVLSINNHDRMNEDHFRLWEYHKSKQLQPN